ncbi:MAG: DedA family protein [Chloroflexi bacterium]|nr:DedA family protein [Chloroflexota bacterium]
MTWLGDLGDQLMAGLLVYGYPVLGLTLLIAAAGVPLPSELAAVAAGALAAQGSLHWLGAGAVALVASVMGDAIGYGVRRWAGRGFVLRRGGRLGLTPARLAQAEAVFVRWGGLTVLLASSLLGHLSPAVNLVAGATRYSFYAWVPFDVAGRLTWVVMYVGIGYAFSGSIEAAADLLSNLGGLVATLIVLAVVGFVAYRRWSGWAGPGAAHGAGP